MTYNYTGVAKTAKRLIENFGKPVTVRRMTNTGTAWAPTQTPADTSFTGVMTNYMAKEIDGTLIKMTDKKLLLAAYGAATTPVVSDRVIVNGEEYAIIDIKTLEPGDTALIWTVQVRA